MSVGRAGAPAPPVGSSVAPVWQRAGGGILAIVLGLLAWTFVAGGIELADSKICADAIATVEALVEGKDLECYEGSAAQRTAGIVLAIASGVVLAAAGLVALAFAITRGRLRLLARLTAVALALTLVTILVLAL
jgi:hypothetical protein